MPVRRLEMLGEGYAPQQAAMFTHVDHGVSTSITATQEAGKVWLEPTVSPDFRNVIANGENIGFASVRGEHSIDFGSGWQASHFPLETLKAVVRVVDEEISRIESNPIEIWSAAAIDQAAKFTEPIKLPAKK